MALDPGTILAVTSLTFQVFAGCVSGFNILYDARSLGHDAHLLQTMLDFEEYRFVLWSRRVGLLGQDPPRLDQRINGTVASELMKQLQHLLSGHTLSQRYHLMSNGPVVAGGVASSSIDDPSKARSILDAVISHTEKEDVLLRAKLIKSKSTWPKRVWWSFKDKEKFKLFIEDVRSIMDALWALLSDVQQTESQQVMSQMLATVVQLSKDVGNLQALQRTIDTSHLTTTGTTMVSVAAGLRATRLQMDINSTGPSLVHTALSSTGSQQHGSAASLDLRSHLLTECAIMNQDNLASVGRYAGQAVYVEFKPVSFKMKGPLRGRVQDITSTLAHHNSSDFHALQAKGFLEDAGGFKIIYEIPTQDLSAALQPPLTLLALLSMDLRPSLDARVRLATRICRTVLTLHVAGWLHKGLRSENILFFPTSSNGEPTVSLLEHPHLAGFNFSRMAAPTEFSESISADVPARDIYRDPDCFGEPVRFERYMDMYALGTILIEMCEWWPLKKILRTVCDIDKGSQVWLHDGGKVRPWLQKRFVQKGTAAFRIGEKYARLVQLCFERKDRRHEQSEIDAVQDFHEALAALEAVYK